MVLLIVVIITLLDNSKNRFLVLGEEPTEVLMVVLVQQKNKTSINFGKANTKFCLSLHYNGDESYLQIRDIEN